jgi:hypothetical protein
VPAIGGRNELVRFLVGYLVVFLFKICGPSVAHILKQLA